jgi:hypothetical protein
LKCLVEAVHRAQSLPDVLLRGEALLVVVFLPAVFLSAVFLPAVFLPAVFLPAVFLPAVFLPAVFLPAVFLPAVLLCLPRCRSSRLRLFFSGCSWQTLPR